MINTIDSDKRVEEEMMNINFGVGYTKLDGEYKVQRVISIPCAQINYS